MRLFGALQNGADALLARLQPQKAASATPAPVPPPPPEGGYDETGNYVGAAPDAPSGPQAKAYDPNDPIFSKMEGSPGAPGSGMAINPRTGKMEQVYATYGQGDPDTAGPQVETGRYFASDGAMPGGATSLAGYAPGYYSHDNFNTFDEFMSRAIPIAGLTMLAAGGAGALGAGATAGEGGLGYAGAESTGSITGLADQLTQTITTPGATTASSGVDSTLGTAPGNTTTYTAGNTAEAVTGVSESPGKILLADSGQTVTDVSPGLLNSGTAEATAGATPGVGDAGAFDQFGSAAGPTDTTSIFDYTSPAAAGGEGSGIVDFAKNNPQLTSAGLLVGGGLLNSMGNRAAAAENVKTQIQGQKDLQAQALQNQIELADWKRQHMSGSFSGKLPFSPKPGAVLRRPDGTPVYKGAGLLNSHGG